MNCQVCRKFLSLFIDFPLPDKKHSQIEKHLTDCEDCRKELKALSDTIKLIQRVPTAHMPEDFLPRLRARLNSETSQPREWRLWNPWAWGTIAAAAMILLTLLLYQSFNDSGLPDIQPTTSVSSAPVNQIKPNSYSADYIPPAAWSESEAPLLEKYKRNIDSIFNQTVQRPVSLPTSEKSDLYQAVGYSTGASDSIHPSDAEEIISTPEPKPLYGQKEEWTGERCNITSPRNLLLRNAEDIKALWLEAGIRSISMPELDWNQHILGAIFLGKQPGREYEIQLNEIQPFNDKIVVKYRVIAPAKKTARETTCPFLLFTLPVSPLPVEFSIENLP